MFAGESPCRKGSIYLQSRQRSVPVDFDQNSLETAGSGADEESVTADGDRQTTNDNKLNTV